MQKKKPYVRLILIAVAVLFGILLLAGVGGYIAFIKYPSIGAQGSDVLRKVIGDAAVARLEGLVFQAQDTLHRLQYRAGAQPQAPWSAATLDPQITQGSPSAQAAAIQTADALSQFLPQTTPPQTV